MSYIRPPVPPLPWRNDPTNDSNRLFRGSALKTIFSHARMIADALRRYAVRPAWARRPRGRPPGGARPGGVPSAHRRFALDFDPYRGDGPVADNAMSLHTSQSGNPSTRLAMMLR